MVQCNFEGYCDRQNMANSKVCLAKEGECLYQKPILTASLLCVACQLPKINKFPSTEKQQEILREAIDYAKRENKTK
jgi:hypothetical protein